MDAPQDIDPKSLPFDQQIALLMTTLPAPLQRFLKSPARDAVSLALTQKYGLHADQGAAFEQAYLYMLIGVYTPDEFVADLRAAQVPEDAIRGLTTDVNEQVFKRLQQEERVGAAPAAAPGTAYAVPVPPPAPAAPAVPLPPLPPSMAHPAAAPLLSTASGAAASVPMTQSPAPAPVPPPAPAALAEDRSDKKDLPSSVLDLPQPAFPHARVLDAYQRLQPAARIAFNSPESAEAIRRARTGHRLPPQIGSELGARAGYVLLGLQSVPEFQNQLLMDGVSSDVAQHLTQELAQKLFIAVAPASAPPVPAPAPAPSSAARAPASVTPPPPPPAPSHPATPLATPQPFSVPAPHAAVPIPPPAGPVSRPVARTMAHDMELLMHPDQQGSVPPLQQTPARSFQTASVPVSAPAAPPVYVPPPTPTYPQVPAPRPQPATAPVPPAPPAAAHVPPAPAPMPIPPAPARIIPANAPAPIVPAADTPLVKQYSVDPYREMPE